MNFKLETCTFGALRKKNEILRCPTERGKILDSNLAVDFTTLSVGDIRASNRAQIKEKIWEHKIQKLEMLIVSGEFFLRISKNFEKFRKILNRVIFCRFWID